MTNKINKLKRILLVVIILNFFCIATAAVAIGFKAKQPSFHYNLLDWSFCVSHYHDRCVDHICGRISDRDCPEQCFKESYKKCKLEMRP